jgi:hypothetical protein
MICEEAAMFWFKALFLNLSGDNEEKVKKSKVIPLHAIEAHGVRGGIIPTASALDEGEW